MYTHLYVDGILLRSLRSTHGRQLLAASPRLEKTRDPFRRFLKAMLHATAKLKWLPSGTPQLLWNITIVGSTSTFKFTFHHFVTLLMTEPNDDARGRYIPISRDFFLIIVLCFVLACVMISLGRPFAVTWLSDEDFL